MVYGPSCSAINPQPLTINPSSHQRPPKPIRRRRGRNRTALLIGGWHPSRPFYLLFLDPMCQQGTLSGPPKLKTHWELHYFNGQPLGPWLCHDFGPQIDQRPIGHDIVCEVKPDRRIAGIRTTADQQVQILAIRLINGVLFDSQLAGMVALLVTP